MYSLVLFLISLTLAVSVNKSGFLERGASDRFVWHIITPAEELYHLTANTQCHLYHSDGWNQK